MVILGLHSGHDAAAAIFKDYKLVAFVKEERITRIKSDGRKIPFDAIAECLQIANITMKDVDALCMSRAHFPIQYYKKTSQWQDKFRKNIGIKKIKILATEMAKQQVYNELDIIDKEYIIKDLGLRDDVVVDFSNHHYSHMLGSFYYTTWNSNALYVTADGGGDGVFYSAYYYDGKSLQEIYGGDSYIYKSAQKQASIGDAYSYVTKILGFTPNKHEGKITGLAALGTPLYKEEIIKHFFITEDGSIKSHLADEKSMEKVLDSIKQKSSPEDLAASIQVATEIIITDWIKQLMKCYKVSYIGMSGGVFSNVKLNQAVAGIEGIQDLFIFPPMGDEGLCVGNIISFLIKTEGLENISQYRQKMQIPYYGKKYTKKEILDAVPNEFFIYKEDDYIKKSAMLLQQYVGAIFFSGMEAGPRALGARSMLASPADRKINENLNQRLNRTEFMPFAPYVRDIDAKDIFSIKDSMETACKFMTITTNVKEKYIDTIPAVVHVDKTARPQIIQREDNYLYYDILTEFKNLTSLPVLINTSFNAHEEPIINRPEEAFESLLDNRIDFLIFEGFLVLPKEIAKEITKS